MAVPELSSAVTKPEPVPDAFAFDFKFRNDPGLVANAHVRVLAIHETASSIFWAPRHAGRIDPAHKPAFHGGNVIGVDTLHLVWS